MFIKIVRFLSVFILCGSLTSCITKVIAHGYPEDERLVEKLQIGVTTDAQASELLGDPSARGTFDPNVWYYISTEMKATGFFRPTVVKERIMRLSFKTGKLQEVAFFDNAGAKPLVFNKDKSLVKGDDTGVLKDFFQNFGRFNKALARK